MEGRGDIREGWGGGERNRRERGRLHQFRGVTRGKGRRDIGDFVYWAQELPFWFSSLEKNRLFKFLR